MRKPLLSLAAVALLASACAGSGLPASTYQAVDPGHHLPTAQPPAPQPPAQNPPMQVPAQAPATTSPGGVTFQDPGTNPWTNPAIDDQSTFGLDVDTASYTIAQQYIASGRMPAPASVRVEEWVNAFPQAYPAPARDAFAIVADGGPTPFVAENEVLLRIGLQARDVSARQRSQAALTFVIDTSGSMEIGGRLEMVKDSLRLLVRNLKPDDRVAIVTFGDDARIVLESMPASRRQDILAAIDELQPGGSTNLEAGLRMGYDQARASLTENGIDRVVLASDGVANVGLTDPVAILDAIDRDAAAGIELVSIGVGMGNYNDVLLEQLADKGKGFYAYINSIDEAHRLFTEDLTGTLQAVALDAKAQVVFDRNGVAEYRLIGYENRAISDRDFSNGAVPAGAIGAGHAVTALYALRLQPGAGPQEHLATVRLRWTDPDTNQASELSRDVSAADLARSFGASGPYFRLDAIVAATADVLHQSRWAGQVSLRDVQAVAADEASRLPATDQVHAFLDMLDRAGRLGG